MGTEVKPQTLEVQVHHCLDRCNPGCCYGTSGCATRVKVPNSSCFRCGSANLHLAIGGQWPAFHLSTSGRILQLGGIFRIHCMAECFFMPFAEESSLASTWWLVICTKSSSGATTTHLNFDVRGLWPRNPEDNHGPGQDMTCHLLCLPVSPAQKLGAQPGSDMGSKIHGFAWVISPLVPYLHPRKLTWDLKITQMKRKIIFQTSIFSGIHVSFFCWGI